MAVNTFNTYLKKIIERSGMSIHQLDLIYTIMIIKEMHKGGLEEC